MRTNGERFFRSLDTLRIIVVGDVMLDRYLFGQVARISPEAPVPVHRIEKTERRLGGAANVAANLRGLGCLVRLISAVGDDSAADEFREVLRANDIDDSGILTDSELQTTTKTRVIGVQQQMLRIDQERIQDISEHTVSRICEQVAKEIEKGCAALVLSDYGKGICTESLCQKVIQISRDAKVPVLVDPKQADWSRYRNATLVTPNLKELSEAYGTTIANHEREIKTAALALMKKSGVQQVAVTRSAKGILWVDNESHSFQHPALAREVYDVSGAGDTVVAVLAAAIGAQLPRRFALHLANCAAGVVVGKVGTYAISQSELAASLNDTVHRDVAVLTLSELRQMVKAWRDAGDSIVFTNGCFDLIHRGHLTYLDEAAELGDHLIVGVNSDASIRRLKGSLRPVVAEEDRAYHLAALRAVDAVVVFDEDTPYELIRELRPDVLVKGGDYSPDDVIGKEFAGRVQIIPFVDGYSTTKLIATIISRNKGVH